ncbi:hypothetical protein ABPG74_019224 [Tetrahymena malaccensis]
MKSQILKTVQKKCFHFNRSFMVLILDSLEKKKPYYIQSITNIKERTLCMSSSPCLQFQIFDSKESKRKIIEIFSEDLMKDEKDFDQIVEYAQNNKKLIRTDLILKVLDCYYLDEYQLLYAVEYEYFDFPLQEMRNYQEIFDKNHELSQFLLRIYNYSKNTLNPFQKVDFINQSNISSEGYFVCQVIENEQIAIKLNTVDPLLFSFKKGKKPRAFGSIVVDTQEDFLDYQIVNFEQRIIKQSQKVSIKKELFLQEIQFWYPDFFQQNQIVLEEIMKNVSQSAFLTLLSLDQPRGLVVIRIYSQNKFFNLFIQKCLNLEVAQNKVDQFKIQIKQFTENSIQSLIDFRIYNNPQGVYLIQQKNYPDLQEIDQLSNFIEIIQRGKAQIFKKRIFTDSDDSENTLSEQYDEGEVNENLNQHASTAAVSSKQSTFLAAKSKSNESSYSDQEQYQNPIQQTFATAKKISFSQKSFNDSENQQNDEEQDKQEPIQIKQVSAVSQKQPSRVTAQKASASAIQFRAQKILKKNSDDSEDSLSEQYDKGQDNQNLNQKTSAVAVPSKQTTFLAAKKKSEESSDSDQEQYQNPIQQTSAIAKKASSSQKSFDDSKNEQNDEEQDQQEPIQIKFTHVVSQKQSSEPTAQKAPASAILLKAQKILKKASNDSFSEKEEIQPQKQAFDQSKDQLDLAVEEEPLQGLVNFRLATKKCFLTPVKSTPFISNILHKFGIYLDDIYFSKNNEFFIDFNPLEIDYKMSNNYSQPRISEQYIDFIKELLQNVSYLFLDENHNIYIRKNNKVFEQFFQKIKKSFYGDHQIQNELHLKAIFDNIQKLFTINQKLNYVNFQISSNQIDQFNFQSQEVDLSKLSDVVQFFQENKNFNQICFVQTSYQNLKFKQLKYMLTYRDDKINMVLTEFNEKQRAEFKELTMKLLEINNQKNEQSNTTERLFQQKPICQCCQEGQNIEKRKLLTYLNLSYTHLITESILEQKLKLVCINDHYYQTINLITRNQASLQTLLFNLSFCEGIQSQMKQNKDYFELKSKQNVFKLQLFTLDHPKLITQFQSSLVFQQIQSNKNNINSLHILSRSFSDYDKKPFIYLKMKKLKRLVNIECSNCYLGSY